ncbi:7-cyano-7-deazaguanine synthase QueC [Rhodocaloribacter litoris]|uniref:7-cyano-7-deazaguanine synthase QueC n=1 Tax=Rhodocaloribacter litoris TaxID=2558931 RepID=UPI00141E9038|nr:7-cyano-7-deazaguanine synthase QueC [Rhodocaloribacter litoris]QXD16917.1 7-cyano-7-deazaguanine synthase QueC [Rhodocaloribacter litoris]GIV60574.1 MAG: 7-cyano-7-deazaguanine synthase [Rhodothermaceae bacterium]
MSETLKRPALVLFSGGQDSTTCLFWAQKHFARVETLGFDYGQRHRVELEQARLIAERAGVPFTVVDLRGMLHGSALTEHEKDVSARHERNPDLPASFVPGRNAVFLSVAAAHAYNRGIRDLVGGMCQTDYAGYPDCRRAFIDAMETALARALDVDLRIHTPLMYLTKAETWKLAADLGVLDIVRDLSHTDYHGDRTTYNEWGYGRLDNPASILRAKGYEEAKAKGWI